MSGPRANVPSLATLVFTFETLTSAGRGPRRAFSSALGWGQREGWMRIGRTVLRTPHGAVLHGRRRVRRTWRCETSPSGRGLIRSSLELM